MHWSRIVWPVIPAAAATQSNRCLSDSSMQPDRTVCHLDIAELENRTSAVLQLCNETVKFTTVNMAHDYQECFIVLHITVQTTLYSVSICQCQTQNA